MGGYEDGYANAEPKIRRSITTEDKKEFLLKDIKNAERNIRTLKNTIVECKSGIRAANYVIETATKWLKEYD